MRRTARTLTLRSAVTTSFVCGLASVASAEATTLASVGEVAAAPSFIESSLPIPVAPPEPKLDADTGLPPTHDPAGTPARALRQRVRRFPNLRAQTPGAQWSVHAERVWSVRTQQACLDDLTRAGVPFRLLTRALTTPVPVPVVITGEVHGVRFHVVQSDRELELSCELASRLPALADVLRRFEVDQVMVTSSYREHPKVSFHTFGFALDLAAFQLGKRVLWVGHEFEQTADALTCSGKPKSENARLLLSIACALAESGQFSSVLTPNYNAGHRDHLHLDVRPDDPRFFLR